MSRAGLTGAFFSLMALQIRSIANGLISAVQLIPVAAG